MQSRENELSTKISRCDGYTGKDILAEDSCQQWIRTNKNINMIPNTLIKKNNNKISTEIDQITERIETEKLKNEE